ncbi:MAG: hypothetical protein MN733_17650, partial [Nitrososphaera sp.]|nr:hypothetical protein [Nitrososphaera sp.]
RFWDYTKAVLPSADRVYRTCLIAWPIVTLLDRFRLVPSLLKQAVQGGLLQRSVLHKGLCQYLVFYAEKPALWT